MKLATRVYEAFRDDEEKARVLSEVIEELETRLLPLGEVATKGDLEVTKLSLQKEIEEVRREIENVRREIEQVRASIIKWVAGLLVVQTGVIVSIITLLR